MRAVATLLALLSVLAAPPGPAHGQSLIAQDAKTREIAFESGERNFAFTDAGGATGESTWRVIEGTGNSAENYIVTDAADRLYDFGGNYVNVSEDRGQSWRQVRPGDVGFAGEGALVAAPGGDMVGVVWDLFRGDAVVAVKFEAATRKWRYAPIPGHTPYYDRQWIGVVPGPITIGGQTAPWVAFVKGGTAREEWLYSIDGLTYTGVSAKALGAVANGTVQGPLPITASPNLDIVQAHGGMGLTALGEGRALANPDFLYEFAAPGQSAGYALLDPQQLVPWSDYRLPEGVPAGEFRVDSRGWVHNLVVDDAAERRAFEYRVSDDAGRTFRSTRISLPEATQVVGSWQVEFRVDGRLGLAAVAVHGDRGVEDPDPDLLYKLDVRGPQPALLRSYRLGLGDSPSNSLVSGAPRFDFTSLGFFADGRVAVSFMDTLTNIVINGETSVAPAIAVELGEPVPAGFWTSPQPPPGPPSTPPVAGPPAPTRPVDPAGPPGSSHRVRLDGRRRAGRILLTGEVLPRHPGHVVRIQRRAGRRWKTIARRRASRRSAFRASLPGRRPITLRAVAAPDAAGHRRGHSRGVRLR